MAALSVLLILSYNTHFSLMSVCSSAYHTPFAFTIFHFTRKRNFHLYSEYGKATINANKLLSFGYFTSIHD
jgi:hypothetical protein